MTGDADETSHGTVHWLREQIDLAAGERIDVPGVGGLGRLATIDHLRRAADDRIDESGADGDCRTSEVARVDVSRRSILAGMTTIGASGALAGAGTSGLLSDTERLGGDDSGIVVTTGEVGLRLAWQEEYDPRDGSGQTATSPGSEWQGDCPVSGFVDDPPSAFTLTDRVRPGDSGTIRIGFDAIGNPGWLWGALSTDCPGGPLSAAIDATATFGRCTGGSLAVEPIYADGESHSRLTGSLCAVLGTIAGGVRFGDGCLDPEETYRLDIDWSFRPLPDQVSRNGAPDAETPEYSDASVAFGFDYHYVQCRHTPSSASPFDGQRCDCPGRFGISNVEVYAIEDGERTYAGKLDLGEDYCGDAEGVRENVVEPGRYALCADETPGSYEIEVTDTTEKREGNDVETTGIALELFRDGQPRQLSRVDVFGAGKELVYASAADFDGNATAGILSGPLKTLDEPGNAGTDTDPETGGKGERAGSDDGVETDPSPPERVRWESSGGDD
ncbi:hypothetical protein [Salinirubrum litoreum]|uniref:SipW-cognate class signal peptide n=1 Tax=Salinirubrum litoreum TaxID=1126234 RepID=A0ABD5R5U4_9EURY|nr:hypothetical protein [Salinirubrum litoreum]